MIYVQYNGFVCAHRVEYIRAFRQDKAYKVVRVRKTINGHVLVNKT